MRDSYNDIITDVIALRGWYIDCALEFHSRETSLSLVPRSTTIQVVF